MAQFPHHPAQRYLVDQIADLLDLLRLIKTRFRQTWEHNDAIVFPHLKKSEEFHESENAPVDSGIDRSVVRKGAGVSNAYASTFHNRIDHALLPAGSSYARKQLTYVISWFTS